jgi:hypothetical protein
MNRLQALFQGLLSSKVTRHVPCELPAVAPADLKLVGGGLPAIGGLFNAPPTSELKHTA